MIRSANQKRYGLPACVAALLGVVFLAGLWIAQDAADAPASASRAHVLAAIDAVDDESLLPELEGTERKGANAPQRFGPAGPDVALAPVWESLTFPMADAARASFAALALDDGMPDRPSARDPPLRA